MKTEFSTEDVARILGRTSRFVQDWCERGIIEADIKEASGPGTKRVFSYDGLIKATLAAILKERFSLSREFIKNVMARVADKWKGQDWGQVTLIIDIDLNPNLQPAIQLFDGPIKDALSYNWAIYRTVRVLINLADIKERVDEKLKGE